MFLNQLRTSATRFLMVFLTTLGLVASTTTPAVATTTTSGTISDEIISEESTLRTDPEEYIIAACAGTIYDGYGSLECGMPYGNMWTSIRVKTGYNAGMSGSVECSVEFPNGSLYQLGTIAISNGQLTTPEFFFCPYGIYTFNFDAVTSNSFTVTAYLFEY